MLRRPQLDEPPAKVSKKSKKALFKYRSVRNMVSRTANAVSTTVIDGISCAFTANIGQWLGEPNDCCEIDFRWNFDWRELKSSGIERLSGSLIVKSRNHSFPTERLDVDWKEGRESVSISAKSVHSPAEVEFEYHLTPSYAEDKTELYDEMFAASDKTDGILLVDGKKLHVNKAFLSFHSDYFAVLFSAHFRDGQLSEIPIEAVSYEDFGLLMSMIYPKQEFPKDETINKLLCLADRFLMPAVTSQVQHHLMSNSQLKRETIFWLADAYKMRPLLEKTIRSWHTVEGIQNLKKSPEYAKISNEAKMALFDRIMQLK